MIHSELASGRWSQMSLAEQLANIGSEVERALNWKLKNNMPYSQKAFERALELIDLSLQSNHDFPQLRELARTRESLIDFFMGNNEYQSIEDSLRKYFLYFGIASRKNIN